MSCVSATVKDVNKTRTESHQSFLSIILIIQSKAFKNSLRFKMFKFFPDKDDTSSSQNIQQISPEVAPSKQIQISEPHYTLTNKLKQTPNSVTELKNLKGLKLKCVNIVELPEIGGLAQDVVEILGSTSDLKSGFYEGGFKTWECTYDLISCIQDNLDSILPSRGPSTEPLRILDLGCGTGLLGLSILELAKCRNVDVRVDFQDYNDQVLTHVTIPNTLLNFNDETALTCRYFSGDWSSFSDNLDVKYDVILSSETIYNLDYFPRFIGLLKNGLGEQGCLYLAAKTFYFGVGGGTKSFLSEIVKNGELDGQTIRVFSEGVKREIIRVQRKPK